MINTVWHRELSFCGIYTKIVLDTKCVISWLKHYWFLFPSSPLYRSGIYLCRAVGQVLHAEWQWLDIMTWSDVFRWTMIRWSVVRMIEPSRSGTSAPVSVDWPLGEATVNYWSAIKIGNFTFAPTSTWGSPSYILDWISIKLKILFFDVGLGLGYVMYLGWKSGIWLVLWLGVTQCSIEF